MRAGGPTIDIWPKVIGGDTTIRADHYEVARRLGLWLTQVSELEAQLRATGVPEERFKAMLSAIRTSLRVTELGGAWDSVVRAHLSQEVVMVLGAFAYTLPVTEPTITRREVERILRLAGLMLRAAAEDPQLTPHAKEFVRRQVHRIHQTLGDCEIVGPYPLFHEARELAADIQSAPVILRQSPRTRVLRLMRAMHDQLAGISLRIASHSAANPEVKAAAFISLSIAVATGHLSLDGAGWALAGLDVVRETKLLGTGSSKQSDPG